MAGASTHVAIDKDFFFHVLISYDDEMDTASILFPLLPQFIGKHLVMVTHQQGLSHTHRGSTHVAGPT